MRIVGIDPGLASGAMVAIDTARPSKASLVKTMAMRGNGTCVAAQTFDLSQKVCAFLLETQPKWVAIETNVMMGAGGRANGDVPLLGRGAILSGMGQALAQGLDFGWSSANPSKWRKALGGNGKALGGERGKVKRLCPKRRAYLEEAIHGAERLHGTDHEQDAAFLALWMASEVIGAEAGLLSVLEVAL